MPEKEKVVTRNVSIYPEQADVLEQVVKDTGAGSISGAVRYIITDWVNLKRAAIASTQPMQEPQA